MAPPLIGITTAVRTNDQGNRFYAAYAPIIAAVEKGGGLPVMFPCELASGTLRQLYDRVDGLLLPGGGDIDPSRYGEGKHSETANIDLARDEAEINVVRWAVDENRPLFCICRGHQVLNVALGGTLVQDIPSQVETSEDHHFDKPRTQRIHDIKIEADSHLAQIMGKTATDVNSIHHQAIGQIASPLRVTAYSPNGVIEAVEIPDHRFVLAVQWHPEDLTDDEMMLRLFQAFVDKARES